jgi:hypothetical protein
MKINVVNRSKIINIILIAFNNNIHLKVGFDTFLISLPIMTNDCKNYFKNLQIYESFDLLIAKNENNNFFVYLFDCQKSIVKNISINKEGKALIENKLFYVFKLTLSEIKKVDNKVQYCKLELLSELQ